MPALRRSSRAKASSVTISSARNAKSHTTTKAASGKKSSRKAAKPVQATATSDLPSTLSLLENSRQTTDEWLKSKRTKKGYGNYVKGGKKWLVEWTAEGRLDDEISEDAFDVMSEQTPLALRALTAYKCEHLARGFASAEGIRSAFKDYFERVCGCQGDFWKYNSHNQKWEGNPVFESGFKTYYESLKNRHNRTSTATQALPMLPADLKVIMEYLDSPEAIKYFTVTQRLNDELINLQFKDIKLNLRSKTGIPYHEFSLIFRKTNKDPTKVQKYMVQIDPAHPEIDCYTHVEAWKAHMERLLGRRLAGTDYVFPALASTGQIKFGEPTSRSAFETLLDKVGTLMRYLLDELMAYEEGFSDIMMDDRVIDRHETFMGKDERVPVSKADLLKFEDSILTKIRGMIAGVPAPPIPASTSAANASVRPAGNGTPATRAETPVPPPASPTNDHITPSPYVPQPSRIPETKTLDEALAYWEHGAPQKGLDVPLKEWATLFKSSEYTSEAVKLGNIRFVCEEFRIHCNGDFAVFEEKFPGMRRKFTMLMKSVRAERKLRGEAKSRNSRK
ncbi:hypothetical protein MVEN_01801400 [Mycena venus]|uniref:Uncharacterized protein n=1 Tax=Mycena venus TaxID=2733690 RepID=A0A8H6XJD5_9AGAR|nr:hypothetical protein MVEN_01801400 [Mycena venus]